MLQTGRWKDDEETDRAEFMEPYGRIGGPQIYAHQEIYFQLIMKYFISSMILLNGCGPRKRNRARWAVVFIRKLYRYIRAQTYRAQKLSNKIDPKTN